MPLRAIWGGRNGLDEVLDAHDDDGGFSAPVHGKALVILNGTVHDLSELSSGYVGIDAAVHDLSPID
jgi:hypothetical protein